MKMCVSGYFHLLKDCFDPLIIINNFSLDLFEPFNLDIRSFHLIRPWKRWIETSFGQANGSIYFGSWFMVRSSKLFDFAPTSNPNSQPNMQARGLGRQHVYPLFVQRYWRKCTKRTWLSNAGVRLFPANKKKNSNQTQRQLILQDPTWLLKSHIPWNKSHFPT